MSFYFLKLPGFQFTDIPVQGAMGKTCCLLVQSIACSAFVWDGVGKAVERERKMKRKKMWNKILQYVRNANSKTMGLLSVTAFYLLSLEFSGNFEVNISIITLFALQRLSLLFLICFTLFQEIQSSLILLILKGQVLYRMLDYMALSVEIYCLRDSVCIWLL